MKKALSATVLVVLAVLLQTHLSSAVIYVKYINPHQGAVSFTIDDSSISLRKVSFRTEQDTGFKMTVEQIEPDDEWVHDHFILDAFGLYDEPESIVMDLRISKYWINVNNVQQNTLRLNIFRDEWERIEIDRYDEDEDFFYYRAEVPELERIFMVTGEPLPFAFEMTAQCNGNDVCEPEEGETAENCGDCLRRVTNDICVPFQSTCAGDYVMECNSDGTDYTLTPCDAYCSEGACVSAGILPAAGMFISQNPLYFVVVAMLSSIIAYLFFSLRRTKEALLRVEKIATSQDNLKNIAERKD